MVYYPDQLLMVWYTRNREVSMATLVGRCAHCGGNLFVEDHARKCLQCGRTWISVTEIYQFYEDHKKDILADIADIGRSKTLEKWQIPSGSMSKLLNRWLHERPSARALAAASQSNNHLPELPAFSNDWAPEVQIKWLETWATRR